MAELYEAIELGDMGKPVAFLCSCKPVIVQREETLPPPAELALASLDAIATWVLLTPGLEQSGVAELDGPRDEADLSDLGEAVAFICRDCESAGSICATWVRMRRRQGLRPGANEVATAIAEFVHAWSSLMPQTRTRP